MTPALEELLKSVSRAFYLSIQVLPIGCRAPIGIGYLLARAADTIADTPSVAPSRRLEELANFGACLHGHALAQPLPASPGSTPSEAELLRRIPELVALPDELGPEDRDAVLRIVDTLMLGMARDLNHFPPGQLVSIDRPDQLEEHLYLAAGCVGDFWTEILARHVGALSHWKPPLIRPISVEFGKALQLTNVLRDLPADLRAGRCYLPSEQLATVGLRPEDLLEPANKWRARPVFEGWYAQALNYFDSARMYVLRIPPSEMRLRLSVLWPTLIGLATLHRVAQGNWLEPRRVKVPRSFIYQTMLLSMLAGRSDPLVDAWVHRWLMRCQRVIRHRT